MTSEPAPIAQPPSRSVLVTALAWVMIVVGAVLTPISIISFLMLLVRSYGTSTGGVLDWLIVVAGPPVSFMAGIGLLRRKRWAWFYLVGILFCLFAWQASKVAFPPPSEDKTFIDANGVPTTIMGGGPGTSTPIIALVLASLVILFSRKSRAEFAAARIPVAKMAAAEPSAPSKPSRGELDAAEERDITRGWRVGHRGRDQMCYEERRDGRWQRIEIDGEMLTGRAHHVIYFASVENWQRYPEWARHRREEIIARIKSEFREPDYEYSDGGTASAAPASIPPAAAKRMTRSELRAVFASHAFLLGIAAVMAWLVTTGLQRDETYWPAKRPSQQRTVSREKEPAMFWTSISVYSVIGLGMLGLSACLFRWSRPEKGK